MSQVNISDLPVDEQGKLNDIRQYKAGLLQEIHQLQASLNRVNDELAAISVIEK